MTDDERNAKLAELESEMADILRLRPAYLPLEPIGGGYVFPQDLPDPSFPNGLRREGGLTLRDYFAAQALSAILSRLSAFDPTLFAADSYRLADAMLAERAKCAK